MCLIAAAASWMRGGRYVHDELEAAALETRLLATDAAAPSQAARIATAGSSIGRADKQKG
jgi:hypothetical protein